MAYKVIILYRLYMPSYFLGTFTEYPFSGLVQKQRGRALIERFSPLCCDHAFNRITNILPSPSLLSTVRVPLWASTKSREIDRPKPLPCTLVPGTRK